MALIEAALTLGAKSTKLLTSCAFIEALIPQVHPFIREPKPEDGKTAKVNAPKVEQRRALIEANRKR